MIDLLDMHKHFILSHLKEGDICADFTMGNGHDTAFLSNNRIHGVKLVVGIHIIGKYSFSGCKALTSVTASYAPIRIDDHAFKDCTALNLFYLGTEIESFGDGIFEGCASLAAIHYASNKKEFDLIENSDSMSGFGIYSFEKNEAFTVEIPISTPLKEIISVTVGGEALSEYSIVKTGDGKSAIVFYREDARSIEGKEVIITAVCSATVKDADGQISDFISDYGYKGTGFEAICGCTVCETFDGRAFLSGNPDLPGVVFFTSRESGQSSPLYFGSYNYFCDGFGIFGLSSMLSCADSLLVFKKSDDGGGSIFYHTPKETGLDFMPKIYPITNTHNGIGAIGPSFSFFDDPVFISKTGVSAIDKKTLALERSIACRSHNINAELLRDDIREASLAEWQGYLALGINGKIYLADSREIFTHPSGSREYEWYYLCDIGTYKNDTRVYRYSSTAHEGYQVYDQPESEVEFTSYSVTTDIGKIYYTIVDGIKYEIYPTEEMRGGEFHPLVTLSSFDKDLLFFGTDNGDVCVFNNDKRGVAPNFILNADDYDKEEYASYYGNRIHPYFYNFAFHSVVCGVRTAPYDCSRPDLTKNTVKHSLTLKCKLSGNGKIRCEAKTNRSGYIEHAAFPNATPDFSDFSFAALALDCEDSVSLPINEKEKN